MTPPTNDQRPGGGEREVLSSLPRTRPQRRSNKRASSGRTPKRAAASSASTAARPTAKRSGKSQPRSAGAATGRKPTAVRPSAATSRARRPAGARARPTPPPRRSAGSPSGAELVGTAIEAAAELAQLGVSVGARALRGAISRLPRP